MLDGVNNSIIDTMTNDSVIADLMGVLRQFKTTSAQSKEPAELLAKLADDNRKKAAAGKKSGSLDAAAHRKCLQLAEILDEQAKQVGSETNPAKAFEILATGAWMISSAPIAATAPVRFTFFCVP